MYQITDVSGCVGRREEEEFAEDVVRGRTFKNVKQRLPEELWYGCSVIESVAKTISSANR